MKTIKIIDLVNKRRNDEELPKKFKYDDNVFIYDNEQNDYIYEHGNISFFYDYCSPIYNFADCLATFNKEVEIIEEEKEIEKITTVSGCDNYLTLDAGIELSDKINELVDAVNELKRLK